MLSLERIKRVEVGMKVGCGAGLRVVEVRDHGPADKANIQTGDRIVSMDGRPLREDVDFYVGLLSKRANDRVLLEVERNGKVYAASLTLRAIPIPDGARLAREKFGMKIAPLPSDIAAALNLEEGGLLVTEVERGGPAHRAGLTRGMIIVTIAGDYPRDLDQVGLLLENVKRGDPVSFRVWQIQGRDILMYPPVTLRAR